MSPRVDAGDSCRIQTGENKAKENCNETVKTGSREAEEQEVEQQKHMTEDKMETTNPNVHTLY